MGGGTDRGLERTPVGPDEGGGIRDLRNRDREQIADASPNAALSKEEKAADAEVDRQKQGRLSTIVTGSKGLLEEPLQLARKTLLGF